MDSLPNCPNCQSAYTYEDRDMLICPECGHEWSADAVNAEVNEIKDANGNVLSNGDTVIIVKDLKVKGGSGSIKKGTKVKSIRLVDGVDGHDIDCKIDGFGSMYLKSIYVKKA